MLPRLAALGLLLASSVLCQQPAASQVEADLATPSTAPSQDNGWRRTSHGWQSNTGWPPSSPRVAQEPNLCHPLVVVALVILLSIGGLIAFPASSDLHKSR